MDGWDEEGKKKNWMDGPARRTGMSSSGEQPGQLPGLP